MRIIHFCAGLEMWNGMANTARQFVQEELAQGHDSSLTNDLAMLAGKFDRLHVHGTWLPVLWKAAKAAKSVGAEVIIRPAGNYDPIRRKQGWWKRIKKWMVGPMEHAMLNRADVVQATCEEEAEWIREYHPGANVEVTDLMRFFRLDAEKRWGRGGEVGTRWREAGGKRWREEVEGENGVFRILFLGRAKDPLKGVRYLVNAIEKFNHHCPPPPSLSPSSPPPPLLSTSLHIVADKSGAELEQEWDWCDALCLPTLSENFGRVIAEAIERGKFVITTDGAPAWKEYFEKHPEKGVYIKGFRSGTDAYRVQSLVEAMSIICCGKGCGTPALSTAK